MDAHTVLKGVISRVNQKLGSYEKDWVSVQRYPGSDRVRPQSLKEFVEIRLNFEASKVPEFEDLVLKTDGKLFSCTELSNSDETKRKYKLAEFTLLDINNVPDEFPEVKEGIIKLHELIGGDKFKFNCMKKKIKLIIYE